jgi:hypothetical protein
MASEAQGKSGILSQVESLTEQEMQDLDLETIQEEIEAEAADEHEHAHHAHAEAEEASQEEIEAEAFENIEAGEMSGHMHELSPRARALVARFLVRQTIKAVLVYTMAVVRRMHRSSALRRKLAAASRRGPRAVRMLVGPVVLRAMPRPFRRASRRLVALVIRLSFRSIARTAGLNMHEIDTAELESEST